MDSGYGSLLRQRFLTASTVPAPPPWRCVLDSRTPIGGLLGIGFGVDPSTGDDLVMVVSSNGHGLFHAPTGRKVARVPDPEPATCTPDCSPQLTCPGLGPLDGTPVQIAGFFGGGLHATTSDGWAIEVVSPEWPSHRVVLVHSGSAAYVFDGPSGSNWWQVFNASYSTLRTAGFSPSGRTVAVATSSDLSLWVR